MENKNNWKNHYLAKYMPSPSILGEQPIQFQICIEFYHTARTYLQENQVFPADMISN